MNQVILVASNDESVCRTIEAVLADCGLPVLSAGNFRDAEAACNRHPVAVIVSDAEFDGHSWRNMLALARQMARPPSLIVVARLATDRLWLDLLDEGVFDLFAQAAIDGDLRRAVLNSIQDWRRLRH